MKFGTLQVYPRQGVLKEHGLDLPSAIVGRGEGAHILIDDFSVSRRHARLTIDSGRLLVEDLGSVGGTYIDGERLEPGVRHLVGPDSVVRFGEIEARYLDGEASETTARPATDEGLEEIAGPAGLSVALISPVMPVDPGKFVTCSVTVVNRGRQVDNIRVGVPDLPEDWYTIDSPEFSLLPGARADLVIALHPPRRHDSIAGDYEFTVAVMSREYDHEAVASGSFQILPFEAVELSLEAMRSKKRFKAIAENKGNDVVRYELAGRDDEEAFRYLFETPAIELQPGQKRTVPFVVRKPQKLFGPAMPLPFEVVGHSASGAEITARGQLATNPPLQRFRLPAIYSLMALVLLATALAVLVLTDGDGTKTASADDPYAGVHLCEDTNAKAKQDEKNKDAAKDKPLTNATVVSSSDAGRPLFGQVDSNGAPFFAQSDSRWGTQEYARSLELPNGRDWCGTTIEQCGCAMTSVSVMMALYDIVKMPDGAPLSPKALNDWFNGNARSTDRGWVSRGYIYGDVIWSAANELSAEVARQYPGTRTVRFVRTGSGSEEEIKAELRQGRPVVLEVPGHWIAAVGLDGDQILINDPYYRDKKTLDVYAGKVRSSVIFEPSEDLSAVVVTAPSDVKFRITDKQGRVVATGTGTEVSASDAVKQIPGASVSTKKAWRDPTCIEKAPPADAGTNQITLPGGKDDYTIEIIGTGDKPASVDIHTYNKDGTGTVGLLQGGVGAKTEVNFDPDRDTSSITKLTNGTPQAATTPTPGEKTTVPSNAETATKGPEILPVPTATQTPFIEQRTAMTLPSEPGQQRVEVATNSGFELGDPIRFAPGLPNEEDNLIVAFGSFILATPLKFAHSPGEPILRLQRPPGQGPGLPPGITPPPASGPLEPPKAVGVNCETLYQALPKLATFVCEAAVDGGYTTTRWSLNGRVISEFTGSTSFTFAFTTDAPASIAVTACNQTLCRSASKSQKVAFPGASAASSGGTSGTGGTGARAAVTPPSDGKVSVVCGAEFPITDDGQWAQFNCAANFAGEFTSISWSAPGGTPANKTGVSKEFSTRVANVPGTPPSLKISATVCNFGVCRPSDPFEVGIARTVTILIDSYPEIAVHQGHVLTLMAKVQSTGKIVPQGGTVQFFADQIGDAFTVGPSAPLLTNLGNAQATVYIDTSTIRTLEPDGLPHNFFAVYSGGTNAFGSQTEVARIITVLPPLPDGCDSINSDGDPDNNGTIDDPVTDGTCEFAIDNGRNLGAGTILNTVAISGDASVENDGAPNAVVVDPGDPLTITGSAGRTDYCAGCIRQVYFGIGGYDETPGSATATRIGPYCAVTGVLPLAPGGAGFALQNIPAPTVPGVYYLRATTTLDYFCVGPSIGPPETSVGRIIVRQPITAQVEIWNDGAIWPAAPLVVGGPPGPDPLNPTLPAAGRSQIAGISSSQKVVLKARVPAGSVGRVDFSTFRNGVEGIYLTANGVLPSAPVCPAAGFFDMPRGLPDITCVPWEARILTDQVAALDERIEVRAKFVDPDPLILRDTQSSGTVIRDIRPAAIPASNSVVLKVLAPTKVTVTGPVSPVQMGSDFTLTAEVVSFDSLLGLKGFGGTVQFKAGSNAFGAPVAVGTDGKATITWRAGINPPGCTPTPCGGTPFDTKDDGARSTYNDVFATYISGGDSLLQDACATDTGAACVQTNVDIDPAGSTVTINSVLPGSSGASCDGAGSGSITAGQCIKVTVTVTGVPDFPPTGGTVTVTASGGDLGSDNGVIGSGTVAETAPASGIFQATITFLTGVAGDQMDTPGNYTLVADFAGTSALDTSTSAGFAVPIGVEPATVALTLPGGTPMSAGSNNVAHVVIGASSLGFVDNNNAFLDLLDGVTVVATHNLTNSDNGVYDFPLSGLAVATYSLTVRYSGNNYYGGVTSSPALPLVVEKSTAAITLTNLTRTTDVAPTSINSVGDHFTIVANVNPNVGNPASEGGTVTLKALIPGGVTPVVIGGPHQLTAGEEGQHTFSLTTASGDLLVVGDVQLTLEYSGNTVLSAGSTATATTLTLAKATPTVAVTATPSSVAITGSISLTVSITAPASIPVACPALTPNCVELRIGSSSGTLIDSKPVGDAFNALSTGGASGTCLDTATPTCVIWVGYTVGSATVASGSGTATVAISKATPTVTVTASDVVINSSIDVTVALSSYPPAAFTSCVDCVTVKATNAAGTVATILSDLDFPADVTAFTLATGLGAPGPLLGNCLKSAGTCTISVELAAQTNLNAASGSNAAVISKAGSGITVSFADPGSPVTVGNTVDLVATVVVTGGSNVPTCTACLQFRVGSTTGTAIGMKQDVPLSGIVTLDNVATGGSTPLQVGALTIFAVYDTSAYVSGSNGSSTLTVSKAASSVAAAVSTATVTTGTSVNLSATVTVTGGLHAPTCTSCVTYRRDNSTTGTIIGTASVASDGTTGNLSASTGGANPLAVGAWTIYAVYAGNSNVAGNNDDVALTVNAISVTIVVSANASVTVGNSITLTADLSPNAAPGTVRFFADGVEISGVNGVAANTSNGDATFPWTPTSVGDGTATVTATYTSSSSDYASQSSSTSDDVVVNPAATTLVATGADVGATVTLSANITSTFGTQANIDGGTVTWTITGGAGTCTGLSSMAVLNGVASLTGVVCPNGNNYNVTATYTGAGNYAGDADTSDSDLDVVA